MNDPQKPDLVSQVSVQMGQLIEGAQLRNALGFRTGEAFRVAARAGRVPVKLIKIEGRRGWFARESEIRAWQTAVGGQFELAAAPQKSTRKDSQEPETTK